MSLAHTPVTAGRDPERWCVVLHGILGTRANWRTFARRWVARDPRWGVELVDLRLHGDSPHHEAPHTLDAVAGDLQSLAGTLGHPVDAVLGHSYGGKVALAWAALREGAFDHAMVVDSSPGPRPGAKGAEGVMAILDALEHAGGTFATREAFVSRLGELGVDPGTSHWLGMNLVREGDALRLRTNVTAIREMLSDYFARDLWAVLEAPPGRLNVHLVAAGRTSALSARDRERAARAAALHPARVTLDVVEASGHNVHVDAPEALLALALSRMT